MRSKLFLIATMLFVLSAQAKERTIYIRGDNVPLKGNTEVESIGTDTLLVSPAKDCETISISIKNTLGVILYFQCVSATYNDFIRVVAPELPESYILEIRDDKGTVYTESED